MGKPSLTVSHRARPLEQAVQQASRSALRGLVDQALTAGASDVQLLPQATGEALISYRCDGHRQRVGVLAAAEFQQIIAQAKAMASLPGYLPDVPQDGCLAATDLATPDDVRVAFLPTLHGESMALRLPVHRSLPQPEQLGLPDAVLSGLQQAVATSDGLILVCGPTGSGKTTTLHSLLAAHAAQRPDRHLLSIEDPVERQLPGVTQVSVGSVALTQTSADGQAVAFDHAAALKAALRHDPDVLLLGELRDAASARAALQAALSGHLVLASLHCGSADEAYHRLLDMGLEAELLLPALRFIVAQRLVRQDGCVKVYAEARDWQHRHRPVLPQDVAQLGDNFAQNDFSENVFSKKYDKNKGQRLRHNGFVMFELLAAMTLLGVLLTLMVTLVADRRSIHHNQMDIVRHDQARGYLARWRSAPSIETTQSIPLPSGWHWQTVDSDGRQSQQADGRQSEQAEGSKNLLLNLSA